MADVFAAYPERLAAELPDLPPIAFGKPRDIGIAASPRITWEPKGRTILAPKGLGVLGTGEWRILVDIWGESDEQTLQLANAFHAVTHDLLSRFGYGLSDEVWDIGGETTPGALCRLTLRLQQPIEKSFIPSRTVNLVVTNRMGDSTVPTTP